MRSGTLCKVTNISYEYKIMAESDENVADLLKSQKKYRQAIYFYIQAMEKYLKCKIFTIVNPEIKYYIEENRHHSVEKSVSFLIDILATDERVKEQLTIQLRQYVLKSIRFNWLHNNLRYPEYNEKIGSYIKFDYSENDCNNIRESLTNMKVYLKELERI